LKKPEIHAVCLALLVLIPFVSCGTSPQGLRAGPVYISDSLQFRLLPPGGIEKPMDMSQRIGGSYGERRFEINAWVKADGSGLRIVFYNDLGGGMGELYYGKEGLSFDSPYFPKNIRAEYLVADFQFCFYDFEALRAALAADSQSGTKLVLERSFGTAPPPGEQTELRRIYEGDKVLIEIEKTPSRLRYTNRLRGYSYTITGDFS
jgi:hypothetical protein